MKRREEKDNEKEWERGERGVWSSDVIVYIFTGLKEVGVFQSSSIDCEKVKKIRDSIDAGTNIAKEREKIFDEINFKRKWSGCATTWTLEVYRCAYSSWVTKTISSWIPSAHYTFRRFRYAIGKPSYVSQWKKGGKDKGRETHEVKRREKGGKKRKKQREGHKNSHFI